MEENLRSCPFCGAFAIQKWDIGKDAYNVFCSNPECAVRTGYIRGKGKAVEIWNNREGIGIMTDYEMMEKLPYDELTELKGEILVMRAHMLELGKVLRNRYGLKIDNPLHSQSYVNKELAHFINVLNEVLVAIAEIQDKRSEK